MMITSTLRSQVDSCCLLTLFDYEAQSTFSVRVRSTDSAGEYVEQDLK